MSDTFFNDKVSDVQDSISDLKEDVLCMLGNAHCFGHEEVNGIFNNLVAFHADCDEVLSLVYAMSSEAVDRIRRLELRIEELERNSNE